MDARQILNDYIDAEKQWMRQETAQTAAHARRRGRNTGMEGTDVTEFHEER